MPGIVVGVDGSANAHAALEWAMREAAGHNAALTVLTVHPVAGNYWTGHPMVMPEDAPEVQKARQAAEEVVAKATGQLGDAKPASVTVQAVNGFPAEELIKASRDSDLVVVGARGGGGFSRLSVGSVSNQVVHHAHCPVVVVPGSRGQAA
jgi:nucleotide-binding universal stress UspA family protein